MRTRRLVSRDEQEFLGGATRPPGSVLIAAPQFDVEKSGKSGFSGGQFGKEVDLLPPTCTNAPPMTHKGELAEQCRLKRQGVEAGSVLSGITPVKDKASSMACLAWAQTARAGEAGPTYSRNRSDLIDSYR